MKHTSVHDKWFSTPTGRNNSKSLLQLHRILSLSNNFLIRFNIPFDYYLDIIMDDDYGI